MPRDVAAEIRSGLSHLLEQGRLPAQTELEAIVHFAEAAETNMELAGGVWEHPGREESIYTDLAAAYALLAKLCADALQDAIARGDTS